MSIVALDPRPNQADASAATSISVTFNQPASGDFDAGAFVVYGERAGAVSGNVALSADSLVLTFKPDAPFIVGDRITAILVKQPANPSPLLQNGYIWEFDIAPGDGRQDFVTAQYASNLRLTSITSADLDGDGLVDLAFTGSNGYDDILKLAYLRDGELVFGDSIALPDRVRPLYSADLNRDGYPDFLMLHRGKTKFSIPPRISICHLAPDGSLSLEETFTVGESVTGSAEPRSAIINDVNGDGWLDIVVQLKNKATRAAAYVYLNDGTGHFSSSVGAPPSFDKSRNAESIFDRDLNLTGFIDVGVGHTSSIATVNMYLNDGDGNFTDSGEKLSMLTRDLENAKSLDFTGDLNPDIVLADFNNGEVLIYDWVDTTSSDVLTLPVPVFSSSPRVYSTMQNPNWMDYADVDRDGDFDLAVTGSNQAFFRIMLNDNGDFSQNIDVPIPPQPGNFSTADVNGDAALDFIVADTSGAITILYNNVGDFAAPQPPTLIRPADSVYTTNASPEFEWTVPADANAQDSLHFRITITTGNGVETVYDSRTNPELFTPTPPVPQGVGTIVFQPPDMFDDGAYHWSVQAWDGMFWSNPSSEWLFTVDTTPPVLLQMTFPKADYNGKWFAIAADSNIAAEITYTEWNPDYAELSTNGLGGPFQYQNLPAGDNVSAELTFIPLDAPDGEYNINVVLFDKTAQSDAIDGVVGVDHNPPTGGTARSAVDTSATLDFRISWDGATDGDGSGLSGDYRVQYRKDGGQWTIWIEKTNKSDSLFSGEHNSYYEFEASAFDNVGFVEPFNDVAETGVFVNKFANDKTPPPPPLNVRANGDNPSPWQKSGNFTIRWDLPADESGIKSSFWKLGSAPTSNDDFDDSGAPLGPAEVVVDRDGATPFYVWLSDSAGNVDYRNAAAVDLRRDSTLPVIHSMSVKGGYVVPVLVDGVPWFNSQADKYFNTEVVYTEINAQKGVLTTDGLSDSLINTGADLATGENVATLFGFSIQNPADRIYTLKSTIIDSADNKSSKSTPMGLDGHPPQNSLASSPAISASETFMVSWSAGDDGSGSGVAGYDLYYKVNDGPWQPWFSTDSVGSEPFTGQNGFEYSFESVARDFMGLSEDRSVSGEATTLVDLAANDKEPPPPPIDLKANGARPASPWTANADFNITWSKPQDESGVVASYWKLGAPPVSNADTTGSGPAEGSMLVRMTETGKQWLYLWLIDAKGNVDFNNADSVLLRFDDKPPKIVETTFLNPGYGADWYNPEKKDSAYFEITYHEQFADSLRLFSEDWKYDIVETAPVSGVGVRRVFALALASRPTGVGELIITLSDSAGNKVRAVDTLRLDLTPPTGSLASSPDTSGTTSFQVSWSPGQDVGVGVSDTFDVFVKVNNRGWLPWLTDYVGRTALFTDGRDKQIVHFEVVGRDWLGNVENRTYAYESTTYIDIALSDSVAPGPPIDLQADGGNPSPWRTTNEFQVTWQAPQDPTGTPKGWFKLGDPPTGAGDTSGSFIGDPPVVIRATQENGQRLHLWLQDGAGNVDYRNHASVNLRYDATPPKIDSLALEGAFAHRWYNPTVPPHKAVLDIYFKERNPSILRLDPSDLFKPDSLALRTGRDSASFELNFEGMNDADVDLQISLLDSAGNRAQASTTLSLDRTPPRNTVAQSPDTTTPGEFVVSWDVSHVEENGSGLSGIFDVKVQIDDGPWQLWKVRWDKTSAVYVGEEGHKYSFEAAAYDNVGNKEDFLGRAETTTWVVTQFVDTTPPDAPMNMTVNGVAEPLWSNRSEFTINWTQPSDPSGIAKAFYKFDEPPADNNDVDGEAAGTPPIVIEMQEDGVRDVYIWLQDGAGNADAAHYNVVTLKYDGTPPVIRKSIVANAVYDDKWLNPDSTETAQIRVTYDEFFADSLKLFFTGAEMQVEKTELTSGEAQEVDVLLPLQDVGDGCYALAVVLSDSAGNAASDSMFVCLDSTPPQGAAASSPERSITGKFTVSWAGEGAGFDDGSGLSGEYDLRMRIGGGPWFEVLSREKRSSYTYVGAHNNRFYFEVAAWDNAGNREAFTGEPETSTLVDTSFIDQTPPDAPIEPVVRGGNPSPWQNQPEFMVTWQNPVDPSGIATAFYKLGGAPQSNEDFTDSVTVDNGDGRAVIAATEEDGQIVYLWLKDGRGNVNFENAASVLLRYDATPPLIKSITPVQPAFGDNWYNQQQTPVVSFDVAYLEAHPDSLVLANDLFGAAAGDVSPAVETADTVRVKIKVEAAPDGAYRLYAFLADSAGNISEADSVEIHFDSKPPRVSVAHRDTVVEQGKTVSLTATANDENELQAVELLYWQGGQRIRQTAPMTLQGDSTFVGDIPGDAVTSRGVEYLIQASDGVNTVRYPLSADNQKPFFLRVRVAGEDGGLVMADPLPYGSEESAYRMISFPLQMEQPSARDILEPVLGSYDIKVWRFFYWQAELYEFQEYPDIESLSDGIGYWIITTKQDVRLHTGAGLSVNTVEPYVIVLKKGWNDIGLPFNFPVDWNDIIASSAVDTQKVQGPHAYTGRWEYPFESGVLQPWNGYSIYSDEDDISLVIPALEAQASLAKSQAPPFALRRDMDWAFEIKAVYGDAVDASNYFGCIKSATMKWDYGLDYVEAPEIGTYVSLYFPHDDWTLDAERYTSDFRPPQKGHVWDFEVATNKKDGDIRLSFRAVVPPPKSLELHLLDTEANMKIDLTGDSVYTFQLSGKETLRHFKIFAGDAEFIQQHKEDLPKKLTQYELVQNYPNPFNSSTIISYELEKGTEVNLAVYNLLAQKVKQLHDGWQEKGFYQIRWDARDDLGYELGTGVYILRLETPDFTSTRKMVYMR